MTALSFSSQRLVSALNYLLFSLFCFLFVFRMEGDVLILGLFRLTGRLLFSYEWLLALTLTLLLNFVSYFISKIFRLSDTRHALSFLPALFLLALLTRFIPPYALWAVVVTGLGLLAWFLCMRAATFWRRFSENVITESLVSLSILLVGFLWVALVSNTNAVLHNELKIQQCLSNNHVSSALKVGKKSLETSSFLTSLRAVALTKNHDLGGRLFEYALPDSVQTLYFDEEREVRLLLPADRLRRNWGISGREGISMEQLRSVALRQTEMGCSTTLADYFLTTLLLQKRIDEFARCLPRFYDLRPGRRVLPRHYAEALILCHHRRARHAYKAYNEQLEESYSDFRALCRQQNDPVARRNLSRRLYGQTYWWYFFFH